jgi:hypothetical protein
VVSARTLHVPLPPARLWTTAQLHCQGRGAGDPNSGEAAKARENCVAKEIDGVATGGGEGPSATGGNGDGFASVDTAVADADREAS